MYGTLPLLLTPFNHTIKLHLIFGSLLTGMGVTAVSLKGPYPAELLAKTRRKHAKSPAGIAIMLVVTGTIKDTSWKKPSLELYWTT